jgi:hypothetical protein
MKSSKMWTAVALLAAACGGEPNPGEELATTQSDVSSPDIRPTGRGIGLMNRARHGGSNGIVYHGGPVMLGTPNLYYIWYGNWSGNSAPTILTDFAQHLGGSQYELINSTYYDGAGHVSGSLNYGGSTTDNYSQGTSLSDAQIQAVVASAIPSLHGGVADSNGVYFVLTSQDVTASSGFCTQYCGWHTSGTIGGKDIKYSFVGDPSRCPSACEFQTVGPNGSSGADGMASIIAHESEEAISDPDLNAWYDRRGNENADKCAWTFGATSAASNGALYNVTLGAKQYLIQRNWVNASGGFCSMCLTPPCNPN